MTDNGPWQPPSGETPPPPRAFSGHAAPAQAPSGYGQAAAPGAWAPPPKPGLIPLRPMALGTILGAAFRVLRRNPRPTLGFALLIEGIVAVAAFGVVALVVLFAFARFANADPSDESTIANGAIGLILLAYLVPLILGVFAAALLQGIVSLEVARGTLGEKHSLRGLWRRARGRLWPLIGWTWALVGGVILSITVVSLVIGLVFAAGGVAGIAIGVVLVILAVFGFAVLGAWLWIKLSFVPAALMLDRLTLGRAVARSWTISRGYFWRTFGILLLVGVILYAASAIVELPVQIIASLFGSILNPNQDPSSVITFAIIGAGVALLLTVVIGAVAAVVQSSSASLVYLDLRMRKEGLDLYLERYVEARQAGDDSVADPYLPTPPPIVPMPA